MIDIKLIRENPELVKENIKNEINIIHPPQHDEDGNEQIELDI